MKRKKKLVNVCFIVTHAKYRCRNCFKFLTFVFKLIAHIFNPHIVGFLESKCYGLLSPNLTYLIKFSKYFLLEIYLIVLLKLCILDVQMDSKTFFKVSF